VRFCQRCRAFSLRGRLSRVLAHRRRDSPCRPGRMECLLPHYPGLTGRAKVAVAPHCARPRLPRSILQGMLRSKAVFAYQGSEKRGPNVRTVGYNPELEATTIGHLAALHYYKSHPSETHRCSHMHCWCPGERAIHVVEPPADQVLEQLLRTMGSKAPARMPPRTDKPDQHLAPRSNTRIRWVFV
jgi:hypothetical protein